MVLIAGFFSVKKVNSIITTISFYFVFEYPGDLLFDFIGVQHKRFITIHAVLSS